MDKRSKLTIEVAAPCPASWEGMSGDDRVRFCNQCQLNVYNLSAVSQREAEALILETEERLCVRFYRRKDGTILTENCPLGLRRLRNFTRKIAAVIAFVVSWLITQTNDIVFAVDEKCAPPIAGAKHIPVVMGAAPPYRKDLALRIGLQWQELSGPIINMRISKDGIIESVVVETTSGNPNIDEQAVQAAKLTKVMPLPAWYKGDALTFKIDMSKLHPEKATTKEGQ